MSRLRRAGERLGCLLLLVAGALLVLGWDPPVLKAAGATLIVLGSSGLVLLPARR